MKLNQPSKFVNVSIPTLQFPISEYLKRSSVNENIEI